MKGGWNEIPYSNNYKGGKQRQNHYSNGIRQFYKTIIDIAKKGGQYNDDTKCIVNMHIQI